MMIMLLRSLLIGLLCVSSAWAAGGPALKATNFVTGVRGPLGVAFTSKYFFLHSQFGSGQNGNVYRCPKTGGSAPGSCTVFFTGAQGCCTAMASDDLDNLYIGGAFNSPIQRVDHETGAVLGTFAANSCENGLVWNKKDRNLYCVKGSSTRVNQISNYLTNSTVVTKFASVGGDGLAVDADGNLYTSQGYKIPFANPSAPEALPGFPGDADGMGVDGTSPAKFLLVNGVSNDIWYYDLATHTSTRYVASDLQLPNGEQLSYGDYVTGGPDGCLYITQDLSSNDRVLRISYADGTCPGVVSSNGQTENGPSPCGADCAQKTAGVNCAAAQVVTDKKCISLSFAAGGTCGNL